MNTIFWKGKRVLITGHTGFKGSWLSLCLQSLAANVSGYALAPPTHPSLFEVARIKEGMFSAKGDVRNFDDLKMVISERKPEIVIHMAAQSLVRASYDNPLETYSTNVMGTANLLEAVRQTDSVRVVIVVTSDKCYENQETEQAVREDAPMGGYDPYSSSKGCSELVAAAYRQSFLKTSGVALATARAGNVIGGGDWAKDRLMSDIIQGLLDEKPIRIRSPHAIRPWQHVKNPLEGYLLLAERLWDKGPDYSEGWNFGPPEEETQSVEWVVNFMTKNWGKDIPWEKDGIDHPHEATLLKLDSAKARQRLEWIPRVSLECGLKLVLDWYFGFQSGEDMQQLTLQQILDNQERIPE